MAVIKKKTYDDTFLFSIPDEMQKHHRHLAEFMLKADRIENKKADNFAGVIQDIRRYQTSSIIYNILRRDDVIICTCDVELPPAFKVFMAKDPKSNGARKVFIDASGLIEIKNGLYICKNVSKLTTYIFQAIPWLLYEYEPASFLNNSNITLSATDAFVKMFDYILGYFRFNGFNDNRSKIDYLAALYFMINILNKDDDQYTQQVAAKLVGLDQSLTKAYKLYYEKEDFNNIDSFIKLLEKTFKFKGLTTEVFLNRWITNCGIGTQFATELFVPFCNMIIGAYCGSYVVNQKTFEKQVAAPMVKLCDNILKLANSELERSRLMESFMNETFEMDNKPSVSVLEMQAIEEAKKTVPGDLKLSIDECLSTDKAKDKVNSIIDYYKSINDMKKLSDKLVSFANLAIRSMSTTKNKEQYKVGVLSTIIKSSNKYLNSSSKSSLKNSIDSAIGKQRDCIEKYRDTDKDLTKVLSKQLDELYRCKNLFG